MMLEKDLEAKFVREVKALGGLCLKWVCPGNRGVPDRLVLLPEGRIAFVELKRSADSKLGPLQGYWARTLRLMGFEVYAIHTPDEVKQIVQTFKGGGKP